MNPARFAPLPIENLAGPVVLCLLLAPPVCAQWLPAGIPVTTAAHDQTAPQIAGDGADGAFIVWEDRRADGFATDVYARRIASTGTAAGDPAGIAVCTAPDYQSVPTIVPDGAGGAIVAWADLRNGVASDVYAQRLDASGKPLWAPGGVVVCDASGDQGNGVQLLADGSGGAFCVWEDRRDDESDIYAQHLDATGARLWTAAGVPICTAAGFQIQPRIVGGPGGVIIAWEDRRAVPIFVGLQKLDAAGAAQWGTNGKPAASGSAFCYAPRMIADGAGGAVVLWQNCPTSTSPSDVYGQHIHSGGELLWGAGGTAINVSTGRDEDIALVSDGAGGAIIVWRYVGRWLYAQRIDSNANRLWGASGVLLSLQATGFRPQIVGDGSGGGGVCWGNYISATDEDVHARLVDGAGTLFDPTPGTGIGVQAGLQGECTLVARTDGSAVVAYTNDPAGNLDIHALRLRRTPTDIGVAELGGVGFECAPNPFHARAIARFTLRRPGDARLEIHDVAGRLVRVQRMPSLAPGPHSVSLDASPPDALPRGVYFCTLVADGTRATRRIVLVP